MVNNNIKNNNKKKNKINHVNVNGFLRMNCKFDLDEVQWYTLEVILNLLYHFKIFQVDCYALYQSMNN